MAPIDEATFKQAMARFATGVTVVTTHHEGVHYGMTANAFCSVSLDPRLVLVCVAQQLFTHEKIQESGIFAVSILPLKHVAWGDRFAGRYPMMEDRFQGIPYKRAVTGAPILPEALGWVDCHVRHRYPGGDHTIFVGEAVAAGVGAGDEAPLLYFDSRWSQLAAAGAEAGSSWPSERDEDAG